jgi:sulfur-oxidizing protein SoxY
VKRRSFLGSLTFLALLGGAGKAAAQNGPKRGRVKLELPVLADNGNSVPMKITVESPMSEADHVKLVRLISERNPEPQMAVFHFGPRSGAASITSRVRLAGSQTVTAIAEMSDGSQWMDTAHVQVTLSACVDES